MIQDADWHSLQNLRESRSRGAQGGAWSEPHVLLITSHNSEDLGFPVGTVPQRSFKELGRAPGSAHHGFRRFERPTNTASMAKAAIACQAIGRAWSIELTDGAGFVKSVKEVGSLPLQRRIPVI